MYGVSQEFLTQITKSHRIVTRAELWHPADTQAFLTFDIFDGNVTVQDEDIRRTAYVQLTDPTGTITPADASGLFSPAGNELHLYRGVHLDVSNVDEYVPLGVFGINDVKIIDSGNGYQIRIDGADRARKVQRSRFTSEYVVAKGTNYSLAIQQLIQSRVAGLTYNFTGTTLTTPLIVFKAGDDPWAAARSMATAIGMQLYFSPTGVCILAVVPTLTSSTPVVDSYVEGATAKFLSLNRRLTDEGVYSHVVVTGETADVPVPVRAEAFDNNPSSPTYYLGPFGDIPFFQASSFITTTAQAQAAANARLQKVIGFPELIQLQAIVNPALDVEDTIQITRSRAKVNNKYVTSKLSIPMTQDRAMNIATRQSVLG